MRCLLAEGKALAEWNNLIAEISYAINTSTSRSTGYTPFLLQYGVHPRSDINPTPAENPGAEEFFQERRQIREEAADALKFAQARMAQYFDSRHTPIKPADKVWLKLAHGTQIGYRLPHSTALDVIKTGPFVVKKRVGMHAYELELPPHMKIHPVISVIHLEPALDDPYERTSAPPGPVIVGGEERYNVDRILKKNCWV